MPAPGIQGISGWSALFPVNCDRCLRGCDRVLGTFRDHSVISRMVSRDLSWVHREEATWNLSCLKMRMAWRCM